MLALEQSHGCTSRAYYAFQRHASIRRPSLNAHRAASCLPQRLACRLSVPQGASTQQHSSSPTHAGCQQQSGKRASSCTATGLSLHESASGQLRSPALLAAVLVPLLQQGWARADTLEAADASSAVPTDYLITGIFTVVILALVIVTVGVAYLSLSSFFDSRAEEEDKKKFEVAQRDRDLQALGVQRPKRKRAPDEAIRGGGKGFGS
ncbi:hypothetical protein COCSUDRAFT_66359 [Coccomyxa subellipsoidea C-169]|uniref:Uncharacterized protein n=1 Tax=Coccomyxa subellipsoidea (strain C-169) TaxID=574566 RepID=I0YWE8_COCSC|nr:hypothetical protein COCSUDRAFT_66359 [Coccomyxa subellipsoidea C-169]EIE22717.1 hypothetical protein COCSUDRAFT_66359 [Coccomyxa subellipsoidea C-169]|eukprot:XP_005647261.1 hypothetical protein COCSUDRAFT_66359 [Coccomyxa subellipsoidea C-169]